jgi:hypothetical protein
MATEKELKTVLQPIFERFPEWNFARGWIHHRPIGYYIRGIAFAKSWSDREVVEVWRCVYPLYEWPGFRHIGWGQSFAVPGTPNHGWNVFDDTFASKLIEVMENVIVPVAAPVVNGARFLDYLTQNRTSSHWNDWAKALAHIHMGNLDEARSLLLPLAHIIRTRLPELADKGSWGHNLLELLRLIEEDPGAIPAHCEAVAKKSVAFNKLEKYWEPTPFVYDKDR